MHYSECPLHCGVALLIIYHFRFGEHSNLKHLRISLNYEFQLNENNFS